MKAAAAEQQFERAAVERNRLAAVRSLLQRQRVAGAAVGTLDAIAVALAGADANAQVLQVRDGVLSDRQSFYLANEGRRPQREVIEEFLLQYYEHAAAVPALVVVEQPVASFVVEALGVRRGARVEVRAAERGEKRRILELAARNAAFALEEDQLKAARRRERRAEALDGLRAGAFAAGRADADRVLRHLQPGRHPHRRLDGGVRGGRAEARRLPALSDPQRQRLGRLRLDGGGARPADGGVGAPVGHLSARGGLRPQLRGAAEPDRDRRRQGTALGRARAAGGGAAPRGRGGRARQAAGGGVRPRTARSDRALPRRAPSCSCSRGFATRRIVSRSPTTARGATAR